MTIDHNVCAAARHFDQEQPIGPLEDDVLGALEAHDQTHAAWSDAQGTRSTLRPCALSVALSRCRHRHPRPHGHPLHHPQVSSGCAA